MTQLSLINCRAELTMAQNKIFELGAILEQLNSSKSNLTGSWTNINEVRACCTVLICRCINSLLMLKKFNSDHENAMLYEVI